MLSPIWFGVLAQTPQVKYADFEGKGFFNYADFVARMDVEK